MEYKGEKITINKNPNKKDNPAMKTDSYLAKSIKENRLSKLSMEEAIKIKKDHTIPLEESYQP